MHKQLGVCSEARLRPPLVAASLLAAVGDPVVSWARAGKELATFDLPGNIGVMPALVAASSHAPLTTMTVTACKVSL